MDLKLKSKLTAVIPVDGVFRVFENEGKQFKSKVIAIACFDDGDEGVVFQPIDLGNIKEGYILFKEKTENEKGLIFENDSYEELDPKDYVK